MRQGKGGRLLVLEGPDFVGRTTHVRILSERLEAHGLAVVTLGLGRSKLLGSLLSEHGHEVQDFGGRTRALLFATDLHDQLENSVKPALEAGYVVIADRYHWSVAIRESVRKGKRSWLAHLGAQMPKPDQVVVLKASPRRQLDRLLRDSGLNALSRFEAGVDLNFAKSPTRSFLKYQSRLAQEFAQVAEENGWPLVDTERPVPEVHEDIWRVFLDSLGPLLDVT